MMWSPLLLLVGIPTIVFGALFGGPMVLERFTEWRLRETLAPIAALAEVVVALIEEHPEQWRYTGHSFEHSSTGISIWVSNAYARLPNLTITSGGAEMTPPAKSRRAIYRAFKRWQDKRAAEQLKSALSATSKRLHIIRGGRA